MEEGKNAFKILTILTGNRPLGRPMRRWADNVTMLLKEIDFKTRNWTDLAQHRGYCRALVNVVLNLHVP